MAAFTSAGRGRVFISYRREDSAFPAGWLYDRLCAHLGSDNVFKDVDSIDPGDDFVRVIGDAVGSCQVLLALIGDRWLDITDGTGHRRLDDPEDFVRLEIEAALRRDVRVIPILVGRAALPGSEQLPDSLRGLIRRQVVGAVIGAVVLAAFLIWVLPGSPWVMAPSGRAVIRRGGSRWRS